MKEAKLISLIFLQVVIIPVISYAQDAIPVMDIQLKNELESQAEDHMQQAINLLLIQGRVRRTTEAVEDTRTLQEQYRHFLRQTTSTANLAWMNNQQTQGQLEWVTAADGHLDDYRFARQLAQLHAAQMEPGQKSQLLYEWLIPWDEAQVYGNLSSFRQDQRQRQLHREALQQMQQRRQLQLARLRQRSAASDQYESQQLSTLLLQQERFSMTEAERLSLLTKLEAGLVQSQKAQIKADELMKKSSTYSFSKSVMLNRLYQEYLRQSVANTMTFTK